MDFGPRCSGRTTAMLRRALERAEQGKRGFIVMASRQHLHSVVEAILGKQPLVAHPWDWEPRGDLEVDHKESGGRIRVISTRDPVKELPKLLRGFDPDFVEIDHYVWEWFIEAHENSLVRSKDVPPSAA